MNFEVRPTLSALNDAVTIGERIRDKGYPMNAERWVGELMEALQGLAVFPESWHVAPENAEVDDYEIRQRIFGNYRILFIVQERQVFVLHIRWGGRRTATQDELREAIQQMERMKTVSESVARDDEDDERSSPHPEDLRDRVRGGLEQAERGELLDGDEVFDPLEHQLDAQERLPTHTFRSDSYRSD